MIVASLFIPLAANSSLPAYGQGQGSSVSVPVAQTAESDRSGQAEAASPQTGHSPEAGDHAAEHGGHGESGVPIGFKADLALWSLIVFLIFLYVLKKFAWSPMIAGLDKREAGIRRAISDAEEGHRRAQALLAEYNQKLKAAEQTVQAMVAEARRDAERTGQDLVAAAQKEVNAIRERAKNEINLARDAALAELFATVNSQVMTATEHVLGRALRDADQERLVDDVLAGMSR